MTLAIKDCVIIENTDRMNDASPKNFKQVDSKN